ncbi:hypothetical protein ACW7EJ_09035, partial [Acinetobacter soli]
MQTRVVDAAGNTGTAATQVIVVDTQAPTADNSISLTAYSPDASVPFVLRLNTKVVSLVTKSLPELPVS